MHDYTQNNFTTIKQNTFWWFNMTMDKNHLYIYDIQISPLHNVDVPHLAMLDW